MSDHQKMILPDWLYEKVEQTWPERLHLFERLAPYPQAAPVITREIERLSHLAYQQHLSDQLITAGLIPQARPSWQEKAWTFMITEPPFETEYPETIQSYVTAHVKRLHAIEDIRLIRLLAANPWWLHIIARSPGWRRLASVGLGMAAPSQPS